MFVIKVPPATEEPTLYTALNSAVSPGASERIEQSLSTQVNAGPEVLVKLERVALAGVGSESTTLVAASGPLLLNIRVKATSAPASTVPSRPSTNLCRTRWAAGF